MNLIIEKMDFPVINQQIGDFIKQRVFGKARIYKVIINGGEE